jgi:DNA adenine methylase
MNTPITYYGGKTRMLCHILPLIPEHRIYVEPFAGGAAVFFAKKPSKIEVLNDINGNIANFYEICLTNFDALNQKIICTLHDEFSHKKAQEIFFDENNNADNLTRAWAVFVLSQMSFGSDFASKWQWVKNKDDNWHPAVGIRNKREAFKFIKKRLSLVSIHNNDALEIIKKRDGNETFQYLDPPYVGARQGHYNGYTQEKFIELMDLLPTLKSKFLLSSYNNDYLETMIGLNGWNNKKIEQRSSVSGKNFRKTEMLTWNYNIQPEEYIQSKFEI